MLGFEQVMPPICCLSNLKFKRLGDHLDEIVAFSVHKCSVIIESDWDYKRGFAGHTPTLLCIYMIVLGEHFN